jgi:hypothetical protein
MLPNDFAQGTLGPFSASHDFTHIAGQRAVIQHMQIGFEQGQFFLR